MKKIMGKGRVWKLILVVILCFVCSFSLFFANSVFNDKPSDPSSRLGYYSRSGYLVSFVSGGNGDWSASDGSSYSFTWTYKDGVFSIKKEDGSSSLARFVGGDSIYYLLDKSIYLYRGKNNND